MPALLGGLFIGVLSALPIVNCCCCVWIVGGGFLAAYLKSQNQPTSLSMGGGASIGLQAGVVGAVVLLLISTALSPLSERFLEMARNVPDMPPEVQEVFQAIESRRYGGALGFIGGVVSFLFTLCVISILSTVGGMVGAAYFRKDVPPALGGPSTPPPLS
jgi:hypothetical protein